MAKTIVEHADGILGTGERPTNRAPADDERQRGGTVASPAGSEDAMALELVEQHGHELRYVAQFSQWYRWDGTHWAEDRTVAVYDLARAIARRVAKGERTIKSARKLASAASVSGIERFARVDRRIALTVDQFDADPAILNTPGGIVDLHTGEMRPCDPAALCTQITAVIPAARDDCPRWKEALHLYMKGDSESVAYLQRFAGYCLWGALVDQIITFAQGNGGNGKGTLFNTLMRIMGSYAKAAPSNVFLASPFERHPTELARLHNARLVVSSEIDQGQHWNMPRLNQLSGGDIVSAHFMRQDDFEYLPKFKLALFANNKPSLGKVDEAIRRRLRFLAFEHVVSDQERAADPHFDDKIRAEWPAILRWAIDGCLDWRRQGLAPPQKVLDASAAYLDSQNNLDAWLAVACVRSAHSKTLLKDLYGSWKKWCEENGEYAGTSRALADMLEDKGFTRTRMSGGARAHAGLHLVIE